MERTLRWTIVDTEEIVEFERALIHQRTGTGRGVRRGVRFGQPPKLARDQLALALRLLEKGRWAREVAGMFKVCRATLYQALGAAPSAIKATADAT